MLIGSRIAGCLACDNVFECSEVNVIVNVPEKVKFARIDALAPAANEEDGKVSLLEERLAAFKGYALDELDQANLMNRVDSKFLLPIAFLPELLSHLYTEYRVLDISGKRQFVYNNQYFDTPAMDLYHAHHNGKLNRYKVRRRRYVDTATEFLEVKFKSNQQRTIKTRIKLANRQDDAIRCDEFMHQQMRQQAQGLEVIQYSGYRRIALANEQKAERLTLDFDLWFNNQQQNNEIRLPDFFIAELKQNKKSKRSPFFQLMSNNNVFPVSFSKYCIGSALLYPSSIKTNRFKPVLSQLDAQYRYGQSSILKSKLL